MSSAAIVAQQSGTDGTLLLEKQPTLPWPAHGRIGHLARYSERRRLGGHGQAPKEVILMFIRALCFTPSPAGQAPSSHLGAECVVHTAGRYGDDSRRQGDSRSSMAQPGPPGVNENLFIVS
jgi:hypothetical protein